MKVFKEEPIIVKVVISQEAIGSEERYIVGKSFDEVITLVEQLMEVESAPAKKARKKRQTKVKMAAASLYPGEIVDPGEPSGPETDPPGDRNYCAGPEAAPEKKKRTRKVWPKSD